MKKFISLLLCCIMIFSISSPAFAIEIDNNSVERIDLSDGVRLEVSIIQEVRENAIPKFEIKQFSDDRLVRRVTCSEDGKYLLGTAYDEEGNSREYRILIADRIQKVDSQQFELENLLEVARSKESRIGYINYKSLPGTTKGERLEVFSDCYKSDEESYTINGKAADTAADIAGIIISILVAHYIPASTLSAQIATAIISFFGGAAVGDAIGVNFTEKVSVKADYYKMRSYKDYADRYSNTYEGIERVVKTKSSKYYSETFCEGITPKTWKDKNTFAIWCWNDMYGEMCPGVKSYS